MKLSEIAVALDRPFEGDGTLEIVELAGLDDAGETALTFVTGDKYKDAFARSRAAAAIVPESFDAGGRVVVRSPAPYADFARAIAILYPRPRPEPGVHATAVVEGAEIAADASVGAHAVVGAGTIVGARTVIHPGVTLYPGVVVGEDCEIHSGARVRRDVRIGDRVVVQNGAVIGSEGFGFTFDERLVRVRIPHVCGVEIGDDCEIGANSTIDAAQPAHPRRGAAHAVTRLGRGVKVDNLVQIGHGASVEDGVVLCSQVGIAGSAEIGKNVYMAGKSGVANGVRIGEGSLVGGNCGVHTSIPPGSQVMGLFAMERGLFARVNAGWKRLPSLFSRVRRLEKRFEEIDGGE